MAQLSIFDERPTVALPPWHLYVDGASRNNPGPAGAGVVITRNDHIVMKEGFYLGTKTNNQAEYLALLVGIMLVKEYMQPDEQLLIISDSQLLVQQLQGVYSVKDAQLKKLFNIAQMLLLHVTYKVKHVLRDQNKEADKMANKGVDTKHAVPEAFKQLLQIYQFEL